MSKINSWPNRYKDKNHRKYNLKVHIVLVTKYRKALLRHGIDDFVKRAVFYIANSHAARGATTEETIA